MNKRSRPKIGRQVEDKRPRGAVPDDGKSQVTCKEAQGLNDKPAPVRICGEDDYYTNREYRLSRLKEALGIDNDAFCDGLLQQLYRLLPIDEGPESEADFNFVLAVLKDAKPVDMLFANLVFQMAVGQLCLTPQAKILLTPINYELPSDVAVALHRAAWDAGRMKPQKIKIHDQPVRQMAERMVTRLMQTYAMQLQVSVAYRKAVECLAKPQQVSASTDDAQALPSDGTESLRHKAQKKAPRRAARRLNGSRKSAMHFSRSSKQQMNSIKAQKSNGRASS